MSPARRTSPTGSTSSHKAMVHALVGGFGVEDAYGPIRQCLLVHMGGVLCSKKPSSEASGALVASSSSIIGYCSIERRSALFKKQASGGTVSLEYEDVS